MEDVARALGGSGHWYQLYWSSDDDLVESLVSRAEACGSDALVVTLDTAYLGWRPRDLDLGHLPFARGEGIAQYTSDPVFRRLVAERVASAAGAAPTAASDPGRGRHPAVDVPQPPGRHPRTTSRARAARRGRDVPRRLQPAVADVGRPAAAALPDEPAHRAQGDPAPRRRPPRRRRRRGRRLRLQPRRSAGRPVGRGARRPSRRRRGGSWGRVERADHLRQRDPLRGRRLRCAGARGNGRRHRSAARLRTRPRRRRGRVRGAAQPAAPSSTSSWRSPGARRSPTSPQTGSCAPTDPVEGRPTAERRALPTRPMERVDAVRGRPGGSGHARPRPPDPRRLPQVLEVRRQVARRPRHGPTPAVAARGPRRRPRPAPRHARARPRLGPRRDVRLPRQGVRRARHRRRPVGRPDRGRRGLPQGGRRRPGPADAGRRARAPLRPRARSTPSSASTRGSTSAPATTTRPTSPRSSSPAASSASRRPRSPPRCASSARSPSTSTASSAPSRPRGTPPSGCAASGSSAAPSLP